MSDGVFPTFQKLSQTPLRDIARGRVTGRLDWKSHLATAGLPQAAAELIGRVVKHTRLFRLEKAAVADEMIAHFLDGLAAGTSTEQLIESFGDERVAARLIRRSKRRGRAWPWQAWSVSIRAMAVVLAIYAVLLIRFCLGRPNPSVDYVARLNDSIAHTAQSDRAWPLWRQAILECSDGAKDGRLTFSEAILPTGNEKPSWPQTVRWLDAHASAMEIARQAGRKPAMGFILGAGGSANDPDMKFSFADQTPHEPLFRVLLPHLSYLRSAAEIVSSDARLAAQRGSGALVEADLLSMIGLGRQLRNADGFVVTQMVGLGVDTLALTRLRVVLLHYPNLLSDEQLIDFAHRLSGPRVAADLMTVKYDRYVFEDFVQRLYTDDGHGDGHMTLAGLRALPMILTKHGENPIDIPAYAAASTIPFLSVSRAEMMAEYNRLMDRTEADLRQPIRNIDLHAVQSTIIALKISPIERIRFTILHALVPVFTGAQKGCEKYLGLRDGTVVGISLELYRRRHGRYPQSLNELTPDLLPAIPADRITGQPVKYRLIDGKPVVYSVGADLVDDGGKAPDCSQLTGHFTNYSPAAWGLDPREVPRGDWLLFPPESTDADAD